ncbi:uncharacterized protein PRCAT00000509001 [Priceomyces carsonii]|uniref:uncharacterized protein n=1 Tax=Priceomyces carsonii TaxID=28549 RepID=UPI002EDB2B69|nr:unnamed protein product [Priceomyces carsonii]
MSATLSPSHQGRPILFKSPTLEAQGGIRHNEITAQIITNPDDIIEIIQEKERKNYKLGAILIAVAIATWIVGLELVSSVLKTSDYKKPCMFSVISGSCFSLNLLPDIFYFLRDAIFHTKANSADTDVIEPSAEALLRHLESFEKEIERNILKPKELTKGEVYRLAATIACIYLVYNMFVLTSLEFTSASNQTVVGSLTCFFTLFIGAFMKVDTFTAKKLICSVVSICGVLLISTGESHKNHDDGNKYVPKNPALGNCLALVGALMYAFYLVIMKIKCGTGNTTTNERKLFGYAGIATMLIGIPVLFIAHILDIETFELPSSKDEGVLYLVFLNGVFSAISDYITILALLLTSPLVTSLSLTSAIPITIFCDYIIMHISGSGKSNLSFIYFLGVANILVSVILININFTSELDLVDQAIGNALDNAINEDELLSPILSPLLSPKANTSNASPYFAEDSLNIRNLKESSLISSFSPKFHFKKKRLPFEREVSKFDLGGSNQNYESTSDQNEAQTNAEHNDQWLPKILVYSGGNHNYSVKALHLSSTNLDANGDE